MATIIVQNEQGEQIQIEVDEAGITIRTARIEPLVVHPDRSISLTIPFEQVDAGGGMDSTS